MPLPGPLISAAPQTTGGHGEIPNKPDAVSRRPHPQHHYCATTTAPSDQSKPLAHKLQNEANPRTEFADQ